LCGFFVVAHGLPLKSPGVRSVREYHSRAMRSFWGQVLLELGIGLIYSQPTMMTLKQGILRELEEV